MCDCRGAENGSSSLLLLTDANQNPTVSKGFNRDDTTSRNPRNSREKTWGMRFFASVSSTLPAGVVDI